MKRKIMALLFISFFISCGQNSKTPDWTEGGTLHKATVAEWNNADENNKLATCADFVASIKSNKNEKYTSIDQMKADAIDMKNCIDETTKGNIIDEHSVAEIAIGCDIMMNKIIDKYY